MNRSARPVLAALTLTATLTGLPAAPAIAAADPAIAAWHDAGRPHRLIIVRRSSLEFVDGRGVVARMDRPYGTLTMDGLARHVEGLFGRTYARRWIDRPSAGTVRLSAALLLGGGTALSVGGPTDRLLLAGGADRSRAAWISGGRARITVDRAEVSSWDPATGRTVPAGKAGRPYLRVGDGGRLDITGSVLRDLGAPAAESGLTWDKGATGTIRDSAVVGNDVGLALNGSQGVWVNEVDVIDSVRTGVLLRGDTRTRINEIAADASGGDGLRVVGGGSRTVTGVLARRNHGFGITAEHTPGLALDDTRTAANGRGGVRLADCAGCLLKNPAATGERVAVQVTGDDSKDVRVLGAHVHGGSIGIRVAPDTRQVTVGNARVDGAGTALALSGTGVTARGGLWQPARIGALLYGKAVAAHLTGVTIHGGVTGVRATRTTSGTRLTDLTVTDVTGQAVNSAAPGLVVAGGHISGAKTGLSLRANATVTGTRVDHVVRGLRAALRAGVAANRVDVAADVVGITAEDDARVTLAGSRVRAPVALRGAVELRAGNTLAPPSFPWLGLVAIGVITAALLLHTLHRVRQGRALPVQAPPHVLNHS